MLATKIKIPIAKGQDPDMIARTLETLYLPYPWRVTERGVVKTKEGEFVVLHVAYESSTPPTKEAIDNFKDKIMEGLKTSIKAAAELQGYLNQVTREIEEEAAKIVRPEPKPVKEVAK